LCYDSLMIVHFICEGNTYRSRLAEAYLNSKQIPSIKSMSSGIKASRNLLGPITWYAQRIIEKEKLIPFQSINWQQTTKELLEQTDFTVFMQKEHYDYCREKLGFATKNYEIWNIKDLNKFLTFSLGEPTATKIEKIKASDETYKIIKRKVDDLITRLSK
jgi:protein-tyrosine-phosphatase